MVEEKGIIEKKGRGTFLFLEAKANIYYNSRCSRGPDRKSGVKLLESKAVKNPERATCPELMITCAGCDTVVHVRSYVC